MVAAAEKREAPSEDHARDAKVSRTDDGEGTGRLAVRARS